jgi:hypothetical protein
MPIDTAAKRFSIIDFDVPSSPATPPPSGSIGQGARFHNLWLYSGLAPASVELLPTACRTISPFGEDSVTPFGDDSILVRC